MPNSTLRRPSRTLPDGSIEILLTRGYIAIIDPVDADLAGKNWSSLITDDNKVYAARTYILLHRVVLERVLNRKLTREERCDHIDGNTMDSRRRNLRLASNTQNAYNSKVRSHNTSGYKGVKTNGSGFSARITVNGKCIHLGTFATADIAHEVYCEASKKYHGEFGRTK